MRQHLILALLVASTAAADKRKPLDVSDAVGNVDVLRDETGKYYVMPRDVSNGELANTWTFYGDGRTMYRQRIISFSSSQGTTTIGAWSPRVRNVAHAMLIKDPASTYLVCRMRDSKFDRRPLTIATDAEITKLFAKAVFEDVLWERHVYFFGRGEGTKYYLVDTLESGEGFRLFVGPKGQMKQVSVSDFASDTGGASVMTKTGELSIPKGDGDATWKQGKKEVSIARLDSQKNSYLIYRELGVYGQLGTFCEDQ